MSYCFPSQDIKLNVLVSSWRYKLCPLKRSRKAMTKEGRMKIQKSEYLKNKKNVLRQNKKHFSQLFKGYHLVKKYEK